MNSVLILPRLSIQNANAVAGLTWGFPALSSVLGLAHALERQLRGGDFAHPWFSGCAIICHDHQTLTEPDSYGEHSFSLTRNPLTRQGKSAPFNEEGRMHLNISLLIAMRQSAGDCLDDLDIENGSGDDEKDFAARVSDRLPRLRLAGGDLLGHEPLRCTALPGDTDDRQRASRRVLIGCLPGFALIDRSELLRPSTDNEGEPTAPSDPLDAWLEFAALRYRASEDDPERAADWERVPRPEAGWFVPLMTGYQAIAPLQAPHTIDAARDPGVPLCPVESVYGIGQWIAPHRVTSIESLLWHHRSTPGQYHCHNAFKALQHG